MNKHVTTLTRLALLTSAALVLGYIEHLLPAVPGIPGIKLGLANTVLLYSVYLMDAKKTAALMLLKVFLSGLLFGGFSAMIYSFAGGLLSVIAMLLTKRIRGVSIIGVSVSGAVAHNAGQFIAAGFAVGFRAVAAYAPVLLIAAAVTGAITGVAAKYALKGLGALEKKSEGKSDT